MRTHSQFHALPINNFVTSCKCSMFFCLHRKIEWFNYLVFPCAPFSLHDGIRTPGLGKMNERSMHKCGASQTIFSVWKGISPIWKVILLLALTYLHFTMQFDGHEINCIEEFSFSARNTSSVICKMDS